MRRSNSSDQPLQHPLPHQRSLSSHSSNHTSNHTTRRLFFWLSSSFIGAVLILFFTGQLVIAGVPSSVILAFLQDQPALHAYFQGDKQAFHDRLSMIGIEEQIKAYYRPRIGNEIELDRYIHQIFYDLSGYVGEDYRVNGQGKLVLRKFAR